MKSEHEWTANPQRLNSLTDGIYAIVITLLVLDLKPPNAGELSNLAAEEHILEQTPHFVTYCRQLCRDRPSLATAPSDLFSHRLRYDLSSGRSEFRHIFLVTMIPYTSSLVGHFEEDQFALILFSIGLLACSGGSLRQ